MSSWVLEFQQADEPGQPILVHVAQKPGTILSLDLLATDGEDAYRGKIRERNLNKLRAEHYNGTDQEWSAFLQHIFVYTRDSELAVDQAKMLEADCTISGRGSKATLTITLRSRIEDITHRLGTIDLAYTDDTDDVDLFGWACKLASQRDTYRDESALQKMETEKVHKSARLLQQQLADVVKAKEEHEDQLLSKFELLLNAKKLKIRNQQRILQTAKLDQKALDGLKLTLEGDQTGEQGGKKRRGDTAQGDKAHGDSDSDGFEPMDVDHKSDEDENIEEPGTPDRSETETASEDEASVQTDMPVKKKVPALERDSASRTRSQPALPRREHMVTKTKNLESVSVDSDEETATEDDEL